MQKAAAPLAKQTARDLVTVKAFRLRRPAASGASRVLKRPSQAKPRRKRDPFTLKRKGSLRTGGVKRQRLGS